MIQSPTEMLGLKAKGDRAKGIVRTHVDTVSSHHLQKVSCTKKAYRRCFNDYTKALRKFKEPRPEKAKPFVMDDCRTNKAHSC